MKRPTLISTILFDLDGTLLDSGQDIALALQHALRTVGVQPIPTLSQIFKHLGKPLERMAACMGCVLTSEQTEILLDSYRRRYTERCFEHTALYPDVEHTLENLSSHRLGVVTTKRQDQAVYVVKKSGLMRYFKHVQGWEIGLEHKPAPDLILKALAIIDSDPSVTLMVGDTEQDILAGKAAGVKTCFAAYGYGDGASLESLAPDFVIRRFAELLDLFPRIVK